MIKILIIANLVRVGCFELTGKFCYEIEGEGWYVGAR